MHPTASRFATLMGTASIFALGSATAVHAQQQTAQAQMAQAAPEAIPEQVLITGSLIHGTAAVGVPVTNLGAQDLTQAGATTLGDLFRTIPEANTAPAVAAINSGGQQEREIRVNIRGLDQTGPRTLLMVDGVKFPPQADGLCSIDPSIIPALALDRVDILADGASATYGSDAIAGVINVILKRGFDGATTLLHFDTPTDGGGGQEYQASQLWGRTWDGGDITLTYEYTHQQPVKGTVHSNYTLNYTPWGLDNEIPIGSSLPGTITTGAPAGMLGANIGTICSNCWAIPHGTGANFNAALNGGIGPTAPGSAATLNWATLTANAANFKTNEVDPLKYGWEIAEQDKNAFVATFDQRLLPGISFYAEGFYDNRRVVELDPPIYSQGVSTDVKTWAVPTINPYYPTGAPNGLRVSYDFGIEEPPREPAFEISYRYHAGFNLDLPFGWLGNIYYSHSFEQNYYELNEVNPNALSIALGSTVQGVTKPTGLPYLNLFCDPTAFHCNSPTTLAYIAAQRDLGDIYQISETGGRFDGPLFDLPGGQVKAAIGGLYESDNVVPYTANNAAEVPAAGSTVQAPLSTIYDSEPYNVWAEFAQLDIPVFGDNLNIPLVRRLDLEGSIRHDAYSGTLSGQTTNPKFAFTWLVDELVGATIRGSWGTSFRFANAGEYSTVASDPAGGLGLPNDTASALVSCTNGAPTPGSTAAVLFAAGFGCGQAPGGLTWGGGPHPALRNYINAQGQPATREGGVNLAPETSVNYSIGVEIAPQFALLRGLDLQATFYSVKVNNTILGFTANNTQTLNDPTQRFRYIVPSDLGCPVAANAAPTTCAPFEAMATAQLLDRNTTEPLSNLPFVYWIADGSSVNTGYLHPDGIDYSASYDFDLGDYGAWNTGITGTYYLHYWQQLGGGLPAIDALHDNLPAIGGVAMNGVAAIPSGVPAAPRMSYRARLGWSDGAYSVTGFVNYSSHYFAPWGAPPNVNLQCTTAGGNIGGGTFPCAISNYTNIEPSFYTFDLSLGYNTGDMPANDYLKRLNFQLVVQNVTGRHSPFEYGPTTASRNISAYDILHSNLGRVIGISIIKSW
jgi:iron complex outermembrane recepter protein